MTCVDMEDANTCLHMAILGGKPWMLSTLIKQVGAQNLPWGMTNNQENVEHRFCRITQVSNFLSCIGVFFVKLPQKSMTYLVFAIMPENFDFD